MAKSDDAQVRVFVSYSHKDLRWLERLKVHLRPLERGYNFEYWDDTKLTAGSKWRERIKEAVDNATTAILIISADFLASEFINTDELPPLLKAAQEEGMLILPIIASPCLFLKNTELAQFQAVNIPSKALILISEGEQEAVFLRVAEMLFERVSVPRTQSDQAVMKSGATAKETFREEFLEHSTWTRLLKIGNWIFDEQRARIIGSGMRSYLLSREEYGETPFVIRAELEFSNFERPTDNKLGMNAGIIFGWKTEKGINRYYNVLLTGSELLIERIGFNGGVETQDYERIIDPIPFRPASEKPNKFEVRVNADKIEIHINDTHAQSMDRGTGVVGRVGLRPWRSKMDCTLFTVTGNNQ
jgi:TIR domain